MDKLLELKPIKNVFSELENFLPKILGTIIFFIIAWLFLKLILFIVKKSLKYVKIDSFTTKFIKNSSVFNTKINIKPTKIILTFVKWFFILIFIIIGSDILGLEIVSNEVSRILAYLPQVFSAFIIFVFGVYLATILSKSSKAMLGSFDINGSNIISKIVFYIVFLIITIIALNQSGVNTEVITDNMSIILGAVLASFTIGFGFGSKEVISRLLFSFYVRKNFKIGQQVRINDFEGKIVSIDNICMVIENHTGKRVYPIDKISNSLIEIL